MSRNELYRAHVAAGGDWVIVTLQDDLSVHLEVAGHKGITLPPDKARLLTMSLEDALQAAAVVRATREGVRK